MHVVLILVGFAQFALGIAILGGARSAIHETVAAIAIGSGTITVTLCLAITHLIAIRRALEGRSR